MKIFQGGARNLSHQLGVQQDRGKRNLQRHHFLFCFPNSVSSGSSLSFTLLLVNLATRTGLLPRLRPNCLGNNTVSDGLLRTRNPRPVSWNKTGPIVLVLWSLKRVDFYLTGEGINAHTLLAILPIFRQYLELCKSQVKNQDSKS